MSHLCRACQHPKRQEIDMDLMTHAASYRRMAARYGLSDIGLRHHERRHLGMSWELSKGLQAMLSAQNLLTKLSELNDRTEQLLTAAEQQGEIRTALVAVRESRGNIEAYSRISLEQDIERRIADIENRLNAGGTSTPQP